MERGFVLTSPFGPRDDGFHWGVDFGWTSGSGGLPVYAVQAGRVDRSGPASGFGQWVCVDHPAQAGGGYSVYGHVIPEVRVGEQVQAGQRIAHINPDSATNGGVPPHLHLETHRYTWVPPGPERLDPIAWLGDATYPGEPATQKGDPVVDALFADVSYFQVPVDDSYPHEIFSFRSNDGTFEDPNFAANYEWACKAADSGKLACFIVYFYWRPNWLDTVTVHRRMIEALGGPHPKMISMIDLESGGNPGGDQSDGINKAFWNIADWLGNQKRVIGYANSGDFESMWRVRPDGLRMIAAGYGRNPQLPGQIAHQYTDGQGFGGGLPEGCPPFGRCDMNSADGMSPTDFAAACGIEEGGPFMALTDDEQCELLAKTREIWDQLRGPGGDGWPQLGQDSEGHNLTPVDFLATLKPQAKP